MIGFFTKTKRTERPQAPAHARTAGKIIVNFGGRASKAVLEMAAATLQAGGFDAVAAQPRPTEIGARMPDGTIYAGVSPDTGKAMYVIPSDALTYTFNDANKFAKSLDAHGHRDWRVPTKGELNVLFNNRAAIGGFNATVSNPSRWYWSSSSKLLWNAWGQRFSDGHQDNGDKFNHLSVRCVR